MSSNGGTPQMYAELYVYDGTTFTLIATSSNEIIYDGTTLNLYTFAMAVPATTLTLTDRLAVKLYATNSGGKTTTIHTQDGHLCQIITTFSTGITALNGLTAQVQYFQTGTSGTDFNISSTTATHTFNIPDASATARGLITTGTQTIAGTKTFNDATKNNGGIFLQNASSSSLAGYMNLGGLTNGVKFTSGGGISNTFTLPSATGYTFTFPNATGTVALTSDLTGYLTAVTATSPLSSSGGTTPNITISQATTSTNGYLSSTDWNTFNLKQPQLNGTGFVKATGTTISYDNSTYALDSAVVHNTGTETIGGAKTFSTFTKFDGGVILKNNVSASLAGYVGLSAYSASGNKGINIDFDTYSNSFYFSGTLPYQYTFPAATGTIALVGGSGVGTVTSVAALTLGTSGTDLSSSVATSTTTPVITLNVPTASAANRGALSSADWTTFNNKQSALTNPVTGTGTTNYLPKFTGASTIGNSLVYDNGTSVGISTATLVDRLTIYGGIALTQIGAEYIYSNGGSGGAVNAGFQFDGANNIIKAFTNNTEKMRITSSGNLGLGVTPSAWSGFTALQLGGNTYSAFASSNNYLIVSANAYYDGTGFKYITTGASSRYQQSGGGHEWHTAPSGAAANNPITFTQAMTLTAAGRLLIGTPTEATYMLDVNGTGRFSGDLTLSSGGDRIFSINDTGGNLFQIQAASNILYYSARSTGGSLAFRTNGTNDVKLSIASTGAATFSSSVDATKGTFTSAPSLGGEQIRAYSNSGANTSYGGLLVLSSTGKGGYLTSGDNSTTTWYGAQAGYVTLAGTAGAAMKFRVDADDTKGLTIATTGAATFSSTCTATGFFESSDSRLKTLIQDNYQTKGIASITPKLYTKNGKVELGYYAQDFVGILDSAVSKGSDDMLSLSYREVLVAKVYALEQRIKELENK
jgi:hypothetical protein